VKTEFILPFVIEVVPWGAEFPTRHVIHVRSTDRERLHGCVALVRSGDWQNTNSAQRVK
jgi:hypothetical protein